jgi:signal transduction histidine kinase
MKKYIALFLLLCQNLLFSQSGLDSLLAINLEQLSPKKKANTLNNLAREYFIVGNYQNGAQVGKRTIALGTIIKDDTIVGQSAFYTALNYSEFNIDSAIYYGELAREILNRLNHPWYIYTIDNLSVYYIQNAMYPKALEYRLIDMEYRKQEKDTLGLLEAYVRIGFLYDRVLDYREAFKWYEKSMKLASLAKSEYYVAKTHGYIGIAYDDMGMYDSAHFHNSIAVEGYLKDGDVYYAKTWYSNIGNTYLKQGNFTEAEKYLQLSLEDIDEKMAEAGVRLINLGRVYVELNQWSKAEDFLRRGIENCINHKQIKFLSEGYFHLAELYKRKGQFKEALDYFVLYEKYKEEMLSQDKTNQVSYLQVKFDTEEKEKLILQEQNRNQELLNEKLATDLQLAQRNNLLITAAVILLIGGISAYTLLQRNKKRLEMEKQQALLIEKENSLQAVINAQEEERGRVARELHDGIVQDLTAIYNHLTQVVPMVQDAAKEKLNALSANLQAASKDVRNISHQLMPMALRELGLVAALDDMLNKVLSPLSIEFDFESLGIDNRLPEKIEVSLYRIAQELINNIIKHSGASRVSVMLNNRGGFVTLLVEDNGKGFEYTPSSTGIGLSSINSRINMVHGELKYESSQETGTITIVRIPLVG